MDVLFGVRKGRRARAAACPWGSGRDVSGSLDCTGSASEMERSARGTGVYASLRHASSNPADMGWERSPLHWITCAAVNTATMRKGTSRIDGVSLTRTMGMEVVILRPAACPSAVGAAVEHSVVEGGDSMASGAHG